MQTSVDNPLPQGTVIEYRLGQELSLGIVVSTPIIYYCEPKYGEYIVAKLATSGTAFERCYSLKEANVAGLHGSHYLFPNIQTVRSTSVKKVIGTISETDLQGALAWLSNILAISLDYSQAQNYEYAPGTVVWKDYQFLDHTGSKIRPMVIVSQSQITQTSNIVISLYITSQIVKATCDTDWILYDWQSAGLSRQSAVRCRFQTDPVRNVLSVAKRLTPYDFAEVQRSLRKAFGLPED